MRTKNFLLALVVAANVVLALALWVTVSPPAPAFAQQAGISGRYVAIAAQTQNNFDALYLLDYTDRRLYVFLPRRGGQYNTTLDLLAGRDLKRDFRGN